MQALTVSQFVEYLNAALSAAVFPEGAAIEGEVSGFNVSQGKWIWFNLKDATGTVSCFATVWQLRTPLEDGMQIRVYGTPKVHPKSGKFSVNVDRAEMVGEGALRRAFELLKKRLELEGLFAPERKRPLPRFPGRIGVIASRESAAYGDFLRILGDRWGGMEVKLYHVQVQGREAVGDIMRAFAWFNAHPKDADVLVLTRGGGSLEDLQAFNSEEVARAVYASKIPVVVAVGHERDESLADYAADVRASTPSNAAERLVPDRADMERDLDAGVRHMAAVVDAEIARRRHRIEGFAVRFEAQLRHRTDAFHGTVERLIRSAQQRIRATGDELMARERMLRSLDPKRLLAQGYAVVRSGGKVLKDVRTLKPGAALSIQVRRGAADATVTEIHP
jgi:exodeoxyribonuclease VII large subunit